MNSREEALLTLGRWLKEQSYTFITPTPETLRRVNQRPDSKEARSLRDVFGFSRPYRAGLLPQQVESWLETAELVRNEGELRRAEVRFSSLGTLLLTHSAYPTTSSDAVFFGPDTYRFCRLLEQWKREAERAVDIGCGSGAGGLFVSPRVKELVLCDVNPRALSLARVNAALAGRSAHVQQSDVLNQLAGKFDLIVANPPYMRDPSARVYRDGGGSHGEGLSVRIVREALPRLAWGGTLIVYTGAAVVRGRDCFLDQVHALLSQRGLPYDYEELDPDVFGEELDEPGYEDVERIAAVGLRVTAPRP